MEDERGVENGSKYMSNIVKRHFNLSSVPVPVKWSCKDGKKAAIELCLYHLCHAHKKSKLGTLLLHLNAPSSVSGFIGRTPALL
ncbi:hypothetical protein Rhopal_001945-T1 [Rhodotorula paludigena]|uniref:Uncharacterized protein n=1 Tax=Rhodotorula paludigena TaxID=86838 RepID=A0AAV5GEM9_9BASI|nr:hypothetical protein Rhopal_001945-T1 [Rhodotorula paludigena]